MKLSTFVLVSLALLQAGCAAMLASKTATIPIDSSPSQAEVFVDGVSRGFTPLHLDLEPKRSYTIVLKKEGQADTVYELHNSVGAGWVVADVLLTALVGVIVDASTGAWYQLDETPVVVPLLPPRGEGAAPLATGLAPGAPVAPPPPCHVEGTEQWEHASPAEKKKLLEQCRRQPASAVTPPG